MKEFLQQTIKEAGKLALEYFHQGVETKIKLNLGDLVTVADEKVSEFLVEKISHAYPEHKITSEELKESVNGDKSEYEWVIDPIDGTRNFAMGIPMWCNLVALLKDGELYMSAIYNPVVDELFFAHAGHGAYLNNFPINVNTTENVDYAYAIISKAMEQNALYGAYMDWMIRAMKKFAEETSVWNLNFGTMLSMAYVASGGIDLFVTNSGLDHDYLAPVLLIREAGGVVTDSEGKPWKRGRRDVVAANPVLHGKIMELLN